MNEGVADIGASPPQADNQNDAQYEEINQQQRSGQSREEGNEGENGGAGNEDREMPDENDREGSGDEDEGSEGDSDDGKSTQMLMGVQMTRRSIPQPTRLKRGLSQEVAEQSQKLL